VNDCHSQHTKRIVDLQSRISQVLAGILLEIATTVCDWILQYG